MDDPSPLYAPLRDRAAKGWLGFPAGTVAFYGPTDSLASKVAVAILPEEGEEPSAVRCWTIPEGDIRTDAVVGDEVLRFLDEGGVASVIVPDRILGCPHEEGPDYPEGEACSECTFWLDRDRWEGDLIR